MKILITSIIDLQKGPPSRLHWFIKHLSKNHDITVLCINDWWKASKHGTSLYAREFQFGEVSVHYLTLKRISPVIQEITSPTTTHRFLLKMSGRDFDVHLNYNSLTSGYSMAKKLKALGIKTVYDLADDLPKMIKNSPQIPPLFKWAGKIYGQIMLKRNANIADRVTFATVHLKNLYPVANGKAAVIPNGVDVQMFRPQPSESLRQELGLSGSFIVGFVGTLREWVDLAPVFEAVKRLVQMGIPARMLVVGDEGGMEKAKQLAGSLGVFDNVIFTGTVPYVKVPEYTGCMDVCVMPLKFDNAQPLSFLQYLACAKPVISTRSLEVPPEVVLYAQDSDGYTRHLVNLSKNASLREEIGRRGRSYVTENHDWAKISQKLEELLTSVATSKGKPRG